MAPRWPMPLLPLVIGVVAQAAPAAHDLCPQEDADRLDRDKRRPLAVGSVLSRDPPLRVHYCHQDLRPLAERVLVYAQRSYRAEVGTLGFLAPLPDGKQGGGPELDIYLSNLGRAGRAQANEEPRNKDAARGPGYVVIDHRTPEERDFLASYVAHEMNHVMQYAMGRKVTESFMEATSAYIDDLLFPQAGILPAMVADFQRVPYRALYGHDEKSCYDYGAALWVSYLVQRHGLRLVERVFTAGDRDYLRALSGLLPGAGSSLDEALREFARWRTRTGRFHGSAYFPGGQRFPEVSLDPAVNPYEFIDAPFTVRPQHPPEETGMSYLGIDVTTPLQAGVEIAVRADPGSGRLWADLLDADRDAPLDGGLVPAGQVRTLRTGGVRPGTRLWVVVINLGLGRERPRADRKDPEHTAQGFSLSFRRIPE